MAMTLARNYGKSAARMSNAKLSAGLKALVIGMGVLIVTGFAVVAVTVVNRSLAPLYTRTPAGNCPRAQW